MQRKQLLAEIDRQSKQWGKDIGTHNQDYRQGFHDGVNRVKELIAARLPTGQTNSESSCSPRGPKSLHD